MVTNVIILYGTDEHIAKIKESCVFQRKGCSPWHKSLSGKGWNLQFKSEYEFPLYRLKEISLDHPEVQINHYCHVDVPWLLIKCKKVKGGEIVEEYAWNELYRDVENEKGEKLAKKFFTQLLPNEYHSRYEIPISQES